MPYNISMIKVKELHDFKLNLNILKATIIVKHNRGNSIVELSDLEITKNKIIFFDCLEIEGQLRDDLFTVTNFDWCGDWSGIVWRDVLLPSFSSSLGIMKVVLIWEGGDYIEQVNVNDGVIETEVIRV